MNGALFLIGIVDCWKLYLDSKPAHPLSFFEYPENDVPSNQVGANDDMDKTFLHRLKEATCLITSTLTREVIGKQHTE